MSETRPERATFSRLEWADSIATRAAWYPLIYWIQMAVITTIATQDGLLHPHGMGTWHTARAAEPTVHPRDSASQPARG